MKVFPAYKQSSHGVVVSMPAHHAGNWGLTAAHEYYYFSLKISQPVKLGRPSSDCIYI